MNDAIPSQIRKRRKKLSNGQNTRNINPVPIEASGELAACFMTEVANRERKVTISKLTAISVARL